MSNDHKEQGFSDRDLTDGRKELEWQSRYPKEAINSIKIDCIYLVSFLILVPVLCFFIHFEFPVKWFGLDENIYLSAKPYVFGWLGGCFGGSLFGLKWTYHCVAKNTWHLDRRPWRLLIPIIAGSFAFIFIVLIGSGFLKIFDPKSIGSTSGAFGVGFLIGYFSDNAAAKLVEVANTLFGYHKN